MIIDLTAELEKRKKKPIDEAKKERFLEFLELVKKEVEEENIDADKFILAFTYGDNQFGIRYDSDGINDVDYVKLIGLLESSKYLLNRDYVE